MDVIKKDYSFFCGLLLWSIFGSLYLVLRSQPAGLPFAGGLSFLCQVAFDLFAAFLSYRLYRKTEARSYLLICFGFSFASFADATYNFMANVMFLDTKSYISLIYEIPFTLFLACQLVGGYMFLATAKNTWRSTPKTQLVFISFTILSMVILSLFLLVIFGKGLETLSQGPWLLIFHIFQTCLEIAGYIIFVICLAASTLRSERLFFSGYLIVMSADFIIRMSVLDNTFLQANIFEFVWILGLIFCCFGLKGMLEETRVHLKKERHFDLCSLQTRFSLMCLSLCFFSLLTFVVALTGLFDQWHGH